MLIEFRVGNYRSFDEPQTLTLVASADARHPDNSIHFEKLRLLKCAAIYGANASGKSNLIKAFRFMRAFVVHSATQMNVGDPIGVEPFRLNPDSRHRASFFEAHVVIGTIRYQYGFTVTSKRVEDEWLIAYPKGRPQHLLERRFDPEKHETTWTFRGELHKGGKLIKERTRDNGLALSRGAELNIDPLTTVLLWFHQKTLAIDLSAPPERLIDQTASRLEDDPAFRDRMVHLIRHADLGISDLELPNIIHHPHIARPSADDDHNPELAQILFGRPGSYSVAIEEPGRLVRAVHQSRTGNPVAFSLLEAESHGTQRFFALAGLWLDALDQGKLMMIDELDCSMHPALTRKLVELFQTPAANTDGAQLVFSTHDSALMDLQLFRRDQIWIVEKDRSQASNLCSLYDFQEKPRNNEAVQRRYLAGYYGGVPVFGPTFEDLELQ